MKQLFKLQQKIDKLKQQRDKARAEVQILRTVSVTEDSTTEYEIKEMHIDCEKKDFEVGKWYKCFLANAKARFTEKGRFNAGYVHNDWIKDLGMAEFKYWQEMTPEEVKEVLTKRCKELGLFDSEFDCLTGDTFIYKADFVEYVEYLEEYDQLWIGQNLAYEKGKFAKLAQ